MKYKAEDLWNKDSPYLEHKFGFKYILKLPVGKTFRYFYNQAEIAAYRAKKALGGASKAVSNFAKNTSKSMKKAFSTSKEYHPSAPKIPGLDHTPGTDPDGHKYVAKVKIGNKIRYFYSDEEYEAFNRRAIYEKSDPPFMDSFKKMKEPSTAEEDSTVVNPGYDANPNSDYSQNCTECTMVYEMRRRGYDVTYNTKKNFSAVDDKETVYKYNTLQRFNECFEGAEVMQFKRNPSGSGFKKAMKKMYPPNSRGDLQVCWKQGGAHSVVWETDKKGNVTIRDAQVSGKGKPITYDPDKLFKLTNQVFVTRLDNLKPRKNISNVIQSR